MRVYAREELLKYQLREGFRGNRSVSSLGNLPFIKSFVNKNVPNKKTRDPIVNTTLIITVKALSPAMLNGLGIGSSGD